MQFNVIPRTSYSFDYIPPSFFQDANVESVKHICLVSFGHRIDTFVSGMSVHRLTTTDCGCGCVRIHGIGGGIRSNKLTGCLDGILGDTYPIPDGPTHSWDCNAVSL